MSENNFHLASSQILRQAGLRATRPRAAILQALMTGAHLDTCHAIWQRAHAVHRPLGLVTVYRTLTRLHSAGLVEQIDRGGVAYFGLAERHHDHVICERCGTVEAMGACLLGPFDGARLGGSGFLVTGHRLDLFGVCRACQHAV